MNRPYTFKDIKGHTGIVSYLQNNINEGTLPHFIIFDGPEGLGKTSMADLIALHLVYGSPDREDYKKAYEQIVCKNASNDYIKRYACSVEGGKQAALQIKDDMHATFLQDRPKVIICDECHGLTEQAQDVFLAETEFIDKNVYIIMLTTEVTKLRLSLRSRAVPITLQPLKRSEMVTLLREEVKLKNLKLQHENATIEMIADWSQCKPRTALNILNAFAPNSAVPLSQIRTLIGYIDTKDAVPLLKSLSGSLTFGLAYIEEVPLTNQLVSIVTECINLKSGVQSYKLKMDEIAYIQKELKDVSVEQLVTFLYGITMHTQLTKQSLIHAYLRAHTTYKVVVGAESAVNALVDENIQRQEAKANLDNTDVAQAKAPTFASLVDDATILM